MQRAAGANVFLPHANHPLKEARTHAGKEERRASGKHGRKKVVDFAYGH
jgi:hypothetical protein